jgi:hypothetical protein
MDRRFLLRALKLGFREILLDKGEKPLLCQDARRTFLWMALSDDKGPRSKVKPATTTAPPSPTRTTEMPVNNPGSPEGNHNGNGAEPSEPLDLLAEAEALRGQLQEVLARTSRLIVALKQHKRQSRAVQAAMASLRKLRSDL